MGTGPFHSAALEVSFGFTVTGLAELALPCDPHGVIAGRCRHGVAADDAAGDDLSLRVHHFEPGSQRGGQGFVQARGVLGIEERAAAEIRPAPEGCGELLIVERETHDAHACADAGLAQLLDLAGRIAAAGFLAVGDQHHELLARDALQVVGHLGERGADGRLGAILRSQRGDALADGGGVQRADRHVEIGLAGIHLAPEDTHRERRAGGNGGGGELGERLLGDVDASRCA